MHLYPYQRRIEDARNMTGMLMEEAILYLLEASGYKTVTNVNGDPTLYEERGVLSVLGRGGRHQIDGIADFAIGQPFSHPQRLLVEVKFHERPIDIEVVRNAVGVLQDVREFWTSIPDERDIVKPRYQYTYAIFSASQYTRGAQLYAYAHDIYLIPLARSDFILPIITAIKNIKASVQPSVKRQVEEKRKGLILRDKIVREFRYSDLKSYIRAAIRGMPGYQLTDIAEGSFLNLLEQFCQACRQLDGAVLGTLARRFPIFLVPDRDILLEDLRDCNVTIHWDDRHHWHLYLMGGGTFSFDLPEELFMQYAESSMLSETRALDLKAERLHEIQAVVKQGGRVRIVTFHLDFNWLDQVRIDLQQRNHLHE